MAKYAGVDLSRWNGAVDFKKLKSGKILGSPVKFVMLRLGYGTRLDDRFRQYYSAAKSAGLYVGVYLYSIADTASAARFEADWALEQLKGLDIDYPVAFDFEHKAVLDKKLSPPMFAMLEFVFMSLFMPMSCHASIASVITNTIIAAISTIFRIFSVGASSACGNAARQNRCQPDLGLPFILSCFLC